MLTKKMDNKETAIKFARYLAANWEFEGSSCQSHVYSSKCNWMHIQTVDEIFDEWIEDQK
jgi:hypothetical protein